MPYRDDEKMPATEPLPAPEAPKPPKWRGGWTRKVAPEYGTDYHSKHPLVKEVEAIKEATEQVKIDHEAAFRAHLDARYSLTLEAFEWFCANVITIRYKDASYLPVEKREEYKDATEGPLFLKEQQRKLAAWMISQLVEGKPVRLIILKARQIGFTTVIAAFIVWYLQIRKGMGAMIVAQSVPDAAKISDSTYIQMFDAADPVLLEKPKKIQRVNGWKWSNKSRLHIETAGTKVTAHGVGSGSMNHILHLTEVSKWKAAKDTLTSLNPSFAKTGPTIYIIESSPNGTGGVGFEFYERWRSATKEGSDTMAWFSPFYDDPTYTMEPAPEWEEAARKAAMHYAEQTPIPDMLLRETGLSLKELSWHVDGVKPTPLRAPVKLTWGQIWWRRWMIDNECGGDERAFQQEYAMDDKSCFLSSGEHVFHGMTRVRLAEMQEAARDGNKATPPVRYVINAVGGQCVLERMGGAGWLEVWEEPQPLEEYVIGADVSGQGKCLSALFIIKKRTGEHVAQFAGNVETMDFATFLAYSGRAYNKAMLAVERNLMGGAVLELLQRIHEYTNLYAQMAGPWADVNPDTMRVGFWTSAATKPKLIGNFTHLVQAGVVSTRSEEFLDQALSWVTDANGLPGMPNRDMRDDLLMSGLIAYTAAFETDVRATAPLHGPMPPWHKPVEKQTVSDILAIEDHEKAKSRRGFVVDLEDDEMADAYGGGYIE